MRQPRQSGQPVRSGEGARRTAPESARERAPECAAGGATGEAAIIGSCETCGREVAHDERGAEVLYDRVYRCQIRMLLCPECAKPRRGSGDIPPVPSVQVVEHLRISREEMRYMDSLVDCDERLRRHGIRLSKEYGEDARL